MKEPTWQIASPIQRDDVMAKEGLNFSLLHIRNRTQSSAYSTMHECFLFKLIEDGGGDFAAQQSLGYLFFVTDQWDGHD